MPQVVRLGKMLSTALLVGMVPLVVCSCAPSDAIEWQRQGAGTREFEVVSDWPEPDEKSGFDVEYPRGWLTTAVGGLEAGTCVEVVSADGVACRQMLGGKEVKTADIADVPSATGSFYVQVAEWQGDGEPLQVPLDGVLVNLPDFMPQCAYDAVYSYAATSTCGGVEIPGLTGCRVEGYADGRQYDPYLAREEFAVPCSWHTLLMARQAEAALRDEGYTLLFFDVGRPVAASQFLSDKFQRCYDTSQAAKEALGTWSLNWYVADGLSGHNFGADLDVGVASLATGEPIAMPSSFDMFGGAGHLCTSQVGSASITEDMYLSDVSGNSACLALHRAMRQAGFNELASEWWHFGDAAGQAEVADMMPGGMSFTAILS